MFAIDNGVQILTVNSEIMLLTLQHLRARDDDVDIVNGTMMLQIGDVNMNMTSHGIVDIKGCQHSKHISISVFQTERFPKWVKMMYLLEI